MPKRSKVRRALSSTSYRSRRKHLARQMRKRHGRPVGWRGGRLYFLDTREEVEGIAHVPKPGATAVGLAGSQPRPTVKPQRVPPLRRQEVPAWASIKWY